jgi:hypothetical protein
MVLTKTRQVFQKFIFAQKVAKQKIIFEEFFAKEKMAKICQVWSH